MEDTYVHVYVYNTSHDLYYVLMKTLISNLVDTK
jgi:hypothetical protein